MPDRFFAAVVGWILGVIVGGLIIGCIDANYERRSCLELEQKVGINLVYTWSNGCKLASEM